MLISDWSSDVCVSDLASRTGSCDGCSRGWRHQGSGRVSSCALRVFLLGVLTRIAGGAQAQPALAFDIGLISIRVRCNIRHVVGSPATSICIISPQPPSVSVLLLVVWCEMRHCIIHLPGLSALDRKSTRLNSSH